MGLDKTRKELKRIFASKQQRRCQRNILNSDAKIKDALETLKTFNIAVAEEAFLFSYAKIDELLHGYINSVNKMLAQYEKVLALYDKKYSEASSAMTLPRVMIQIERMKILADYNASCRLALAYIPQQYHGQVKKTLIFSDVKASYMQEAQKILGACCMDSSKAGLFGRNTHYAIPPAYYPPDVAVI